MIVFPLSVNEPPEIPPLETLPAIDIRGVIEAGLTHLVNQAARLHQFDQFTHFLQGVGHRHGGVDVFP